MNGWQLGDHPVVATYSGDGMHDPSNSSEIPDAVERIPSDVSVAIVDPAVLVVGEDVTVVFDVETTADWEGAPSATPTGTVDISYAGGSCSATVAAGTCVLVPAQDGTSTLTAQYQGDSVYAPGSASTSARAWDLSPSQSEVTVEPTKLRPGETSTITAVARDANGDPIPGLGLELDGLMGAAELESDRRQVTDEDGAATWVVTSEYMARPDGNVVHSHSGLVLGTYDIHFAVDLDGIFDPTPTPEPTPTNTPEPTEPPATPTPDETPEPTPDTPTPSPTPVPTMEPDGPGHDVDETLPSGTNEVLFTFGDNSEGKGKVGNNPGYQPGEGDMGSLPIKVGDWLRFGPGTPNQEDSQVVGITFLSGPQAQSLGQTEGLQHVALQLDPPLQHDHQPGEEVVKLPRRHAPGGRRRRQRRRRRLPGRRRMTPVGRRRRQRQDDVRPTSTPEPEATPSAPAPPNAGSGLAPVQTGSALVIVLVVLVGATGAVLLPAATGRR
ncbi:MAG: Ig-like domain-containing protein [Dehalococcoidia bacterium]|nr:Ig-like domain-containing protein [Dehalococcoidia bacterium]